jgi:restriction endonuclease S subunit
MAVTNVLKLSELEGAKRIDAEYYQKKYYNLLSKLIKCGASPLKRIVIPSRIKFNPKEGEYFDYLEIAEIDLTTGQFTLSNIIGEEAPDRAQWIVKKGDVLISTVRPIRNAVALIRKKQKNLVCSSGFCVLSPKNISSLYLFAYFKVGFIAYLLDRYTTATEYPAVTWNDIFKIPVYLGSKSFRNHISKIIEKNYELLDKSEVFYLQAENFLLEELGLKDFKPKYELSYSKNLSDAFEVRRADAEYFQPAYEKLLEKLQGKIELKPLRKFILGIQKGIEPRSDNYQDEGKQFIRVSNLSVNGFTDKDQKYLNEEWYQQLKGTYKPKQGDLLLTKDATPGIAYIVKEHVEGIISSGILKIKVNETEINKEYLALCINSLIGKMQIERDGSGSVIVHWRPEQVKKLKIPILPDKDQNKIALLIQQSHEARSKAMGLLKMAKKAVEIAIEKDEKEAMNFISKLEKD